MTEPEPQAGLRIEVDADGAAATRRAQAATAQGPAGAERTAVWVGGADDPELEEFRAELWR